MHKVKDFRILALIIMAEKKTAATAAKTTKATTEKKTTAKRSCKKVIDINAESVGFRAGDVYQALATAEAPLTVAEIAKAANIKAEEVLLGMGWLFKEGKVKGECDGKVALA